MTRKSAGGYRGLLAAKLQDLKLRLSEFPKTLGLVWAAAPRWTSVWFTLLIIQGLLPGASVYLTKVLVNSLETAIRTGASWESAQIVLTPGLLMAGILLLTELFQGAIGWIRTVQAELLQDYISDLIHTKAVEVDYGFYESPEYHDQLERARTDASSRSLSLLENSGSLLQNSITLFTMAAVLIPYGVWLPFALLVSMLPAFGVVVRTNQEYHRWWQKSTPDRRWSQYYDLMLSHDGAAAELRLFDLGKSFRTSYQDVRKKIVKERLRLIRNQNIAKIAATGLGLIVAGTAIGWMVWRALLGQVRLGDLALFYQAFNRGQTLMRTVLTSVGQVYTNSLFIGNLFEFLRVEPKVVDPKNPVPVPANLSEGIRFKNVTFRYPSSEKPVLENFNFFIPAGKVVALVGDNGAGKSTLVKLLCRFYDPESGSIEIDGIDIKDFAIKPFRRLYAVLFQFPINYLATVLASIAKGDIENNVTLEDAEIAAQNSGAHEFIVKLPRGYNTLIGKWFEEGTNLSGGQLQRLSLARAFVRKAPIMILDEPTSAMDPWAEIDWLERFRKLAVGKTALIITHRFTLSARADLIYVIRNGEVAEAGTHEELIAQDGLYAQSWRSQTQGVTLPEANAAEEEEEGMSYQN
jgi:ATP-binding cassette, subfamily B, bacterial